MNPITNLALAGLADYATAKLLAAIDNLPATLDRSPA